MNTSHEQQDLDEKRIKRRKFLAKAQYNLRISRDELDQKKSSFNSSFDSRKRDNSKFRLSTEPTTEMTYSPFLNNSMGKNIYRRKENPRIRLQYFDLKTNEDHVQNERRMSFGNSKEENPNETQQWFLEGTGNLCLQDTVPFGSTMGTQICMNTHENKETECSTNFDLYQAELENKFLEMLEREKHNILVRNAVQIAQLEEKMKEKYNYVAKEVLECKLKQDQTRASDFDNSKEVKQKNQNDPQIQQIKQLIAAKKLLDVSMYSEKLTNVIEDKSFLHNTTYLLNEINHIKQELNQDDNPFNLSRLTTFGDLEQKGTQNSGVKVCKRLEHELGGGSIDTSLHRRVEELENDKKALEKKLFFLEGILASGGFIGDDQTNPKLNGDRFKTPKPKEYSISILGSNHKENRELEGTRGKERFFLEVSDIHLTPQRNEDIYVSELKEQIKQLNEKVDTLDKRNAELTEENRKLAKKSKQSQEENEMENSQQKQSQTIKFWKQKCEILVSKYFSVIKKLKDDNDKLKLRILEDYKELKKETHASNQSQIKHNKTRERSESQMKQQPLDERSQNRENKGIRSRSIRG